MTTGRAVVALRDLHPDMGVGDALLARVGGKAAVCARLLREGLRVPGGWVVVAEPGADWEALLVQALHGAPEGTRFAVRSSAAEEDQPTHSFAGIHETFLGVPPVDVPSAVRRCLDSLHAPRALAYRRARHLQAEGFPGSVLVQEMVAARVAGVLFTRPPVQRPGASDDADDLWIEAAWGLGEGVVSGRIDPDRWRLGRRDGVVREAHAGRKTWEATSANGTVRWMETPPERVERPCLEGPQLEELRRIGLEVEHVMGSAQDIEWAHDGERFWVLQARPVPEPAGSPGGSLAEPEGPGGPDERLRSLQGLPAGVDLEWTRANVREVLPDLAAPQVVYTVIPILDACMRRYFGPLTAPAEELGPSCAVLLGRACFNLSQLRYTCRLLMVPDALVLRALGHAGVGPPPSPLPPIPMIRRLRAVGHLLRVSLWQRGLDERVEAFCESVPQMAAALSARDPRALDDATIEGQLAVLEPLLMDTLENAFGLGSILNLETLARAFCRLFGVPADPFIHAQVAAGEKTVSARQALDLLDLAWEARDEEAVGAWLGAPARTRAGSAWREELAGTRFVGRFGRFLDTYGHRGTYETDWTWPRYSEDPAPLLHALAEMARREDLQRSEEIVERQEREAREAWAMLRSHVPLLLRPLVLPLARWTMGRMKKLFQLRERNRFEMVRLLAAVRAWHAAVAERFVERGWVVSRADYAMIPVPDISAALRDASRGPGLAAIAARRRADLEAHAHVDLPLHFRSSDLPRILAGEDLPTLGERGGRAGQAGRHCVLEGQCVSAGVAHGEAVVLEHPDDFEHMRPGAILVAPATDPSWTPLFSLARGVVVEIGGFLSHASTIAREYGLPALANVPDATRRIRTGDRLLLDATRGTVEILMEGSQATGTNPTSIG